MYTNLPARNLSNCEIMELHNRRREATARNLAATDANPYLARTNNLLADLRAKALQATR